MKSATLSLLALALLSHSAFAGKVKVKNCTGVRPSVLVTDGHIKDPHNLKGADRISEEKTETLKCNTERCRVWVLVDRATMNRVPGAKIPVGKTFAPLGRAKGDVTLFGDPKQEKTLKVEKGHLPCK